MVGTALRMCLGKEAFRDEVQDWPMTDQAFARACKSPSPITWTRYGRAEQVVIAPRDRIYEHATLRQLLRESTQQGRLFFRKVDRFRGQQLREMLEGLRLRWGGD